ncbi:hypothetical protein [Thermococcus sp.]|uniref:hypothetical protein n=1 Tax=Thermococcus sp. TaxID=35749 RepID=UPI0025E8A8D8|nr:hypothetical protein [Thermococcus sp.]
MGDREKKLIEYGVEALIIAWLGYLFLYQNYLLHKWHRGLPLPDKVPFILGGIVMGLAFFIYEAWKLEKNASKNNPEDVLPAELET